MNQLSNRYQKIITEFDNVKLGLDDTFKFHCVRCGRCCLNREDVVLEPADAFRIAKALKEESIFSFIEKYCKIKIGYSSNMPLVVLLPQGLDKRCPFLENGKCSIHHVKPAVCAMFPIGRTIRVLPKDYGKTITAKQVKYFFFDPHCGDKSEVHTVREWLRDFNIRTNDEYCFFQTCNIRFTLTFAKAYEKISEEMVEKIQQLIISKYYLEFDLKKDFFKQFKKNMHDLEMFFRFLERVSGNA